MHAQKHISHGASVVFRRNVRALLQERNQTMRQLADYLHVSAPAVSMLLAGRHDPTLARAERVAQFFDMSLGELLTWKNSRKRR